MAQPPPGLGTESQDGRPANRLPPLRALPGRRQVFQRRSHLVPIDTGKTEQGMSIRFVQPNSRGIA